MVCILPWGITFVHGHPSTSLGAEHSFSSVVGNLQATCGPLGFYVWPMRCLPLPINRVAKFCWFLSGFPTGITKVTCTWSEARTDCTLTESCELPLYPIRVLLWFIRHTLQILGMQSQLAKLRYPGRLPWLQQSCGPLRWDLATWVALLV